MSIEAFRHHFGSCAWDWRPIGCVMAVAIAMAGCREGALRPAGPQPPRVPLEVLADFNRGAALMEQYKYAEAAAAFEKVVLRPDDITPTVVIGKATALL